jgi:hypothetical protein
MHVLTSNEKLFVWQKNTRKNPVDESSTCKSRCVISKSEVLSIEVGREVSTKEGIVPSSRMMAICWEVAMVILIPVISRNVMSWEDQVITSGSAL